MIAGELGLSLDQALAFEKRHGPDFQFIYKPGLAYEHIDLNLDNPILADVRVRQALLYAARPPEAISTAALQGKQPVANTSVNPLDWVYSPRRAEVYRYDLAKAKALLEQAGWSELRRRHPAQCQGRATDASTLMTTAGNRTRELVEQVLQSQWRKVGVDMRASGISRRGCFSARR